MPAPRRPRPIPRGIDPHHPDRVLTKREVEFLTSSLRDVPAAVSALDN
jgi:hypothetical protein